MVKLAVNVITFLPSKNDPRTTSGLRGRRGGPKMFDIWVSNKMHFTEKFTVDFQYPEFLDYPDGVADCERYGVTRIPAYVVCHRQTEAVLGIRFFKENDSGSTVQDALGDILKQFAEPAHYATGSQKPTLDAKQLCLFSNRFCPHAERARLTLNIKKIPYEIVNINLTEKPEWYMAHHNPLGKVPTLHEPGKPQPVFESLIVAEYVDEHFPNEPKLLPKDEYEKARQKVAIEVITQKFINNLNAVGAKGDKEKVEELKKGLKEVEESLTGQYFAGDKMGFVDVMIWPWFERIAPVCEVRSVDLKMERDYPKLHAWMQSMLKEPAIADIVFPSEIMVPFIKSAYVDGKANYDIGL